MKWPWYRKDRQLIFRVPPQPPVGHGAVSTPHQDQAVVLEMDEVRGIAENDGSIFIGLYKHGQLYWWARTTAGQPEIPGPRRHCSDHGRRPHRAGQCLAGGQGYSSLVRQPQDGRCHGGAEP